MAFGAWQGTVTVTATGDITISGLTDPKFIMLWGTTLAAAGTSAAADRNSFGMGFGTDRGGTVSQCARCMQSDSSDPGSSAGARLSSTTALFLTCDASGAIDCEIDLVSMDATSVVINVANVDTTASIIVHYLILGGSDLTDALVVNSTTATSSPQDISDPAATFGQPDLVGVIGAKTSGSVGSDPMLSIGWGIKDGNQAVHHWASDDAGSVALGCLQKLGAIYVSSVIPLAAAHDAEAALAASSGWPTNGIRLTWSDLAPNATDHLGLVFLKGTFTKAIDVSTQPTAGSPPVTQDIALSFTPKALITHTLSEVASGSYIVSGTDLGSFAIGGSDGTTEGTSLYMDGDAEATQRVRHRLSTTKSIEMMSGSGTTYTLLAAADAVFQTDNLRLSWTTINATAREFVYVAVGDGAGDALEVAPDTGILTLSGFAPTATITASPSQATLALTGAAPTLRFQASPSAASAALSGFAPTVAAQTAPTLGIVTLQGFVPTVSVRTTAAVGQIDLSGFAPSLAFQSAPSLGQADLTGFTPAVATVATPSPGVLALEGFAPSLGGDVVASPDTGALTLTGFAPAISVRTDGSVGEVSLLGFAPAISTQTTPAQAVLSTVWFAPSLAFATSPQTGTLTLAGFPATVTHTSLAGHGLLTLSGFDPTLGAAVAGATATMSDRALFVATLNERGKWEVRLSDRPLADVRLADRRE